MPFTPLRVSPVFGGLEVRTGDLDVTVGALTVGGLITGQNGLTLSAGNLAVSSGAITVSGNITSGGTIDGQAININGVPVGTSSDTYWNAEAGGIYYGSNVRLSAGNLTISAGTITTSGNITTSGSFVGTNALYRPTTNSLGSDNVATMTGLNNTYYGNGSLNACTSGQDNCAFGKESLGANQSGNYNTAFGKEALENTIGSSNDAFGYKALENNSTGAGNVGFGGYALGQLISGAHNTAVGPGAGYGITTVDRGIFIGRNAGFYEDEGYRLYITSIDASNKADGRAKALIYGVMNTTPASQILTINGTLRVAHGLPSPQLITLKAIDEDTALVVADGYVYWTVPEEMNGWTIEAVDATVYTASTSGLPEIELYNVTDSVDVLSTPVTIDVNEKNSYTATTEEVVANGALATGDVLRVDVDIAGTGTRGLDIMIMVRNS